MPSEKERNSWRTHPACGYSRGVLVAYKTEPKRICDRCHRIREVFAWEYLWDAKQNMGVSRSECFDCYARNSEIGFRVMEDLRRFEIEHGRL